MYRDLPDAVELDLAANLYFYFYILKEVLFLYRFFPLVCVRMSSVSFIQAVFCFF